MNTSYRRGRLERIRIALRRARCCGSAQDLAFFAYLTIIIALLLLRGVGSGRVDTPFRLIGYHLTIGLVAVVAIALPGVWSHPLSRWLRWWYPVILCTPCFEGIGRMIHIIQPTLIDAHLVVADEMIFGAPLTPILQHHASPWLTELFYICYTSYYFLIPGVGFALYLRGGGSYAPFREFMLAVSLTFWVCFLHFLLTPAGGPVFWPDYPAHVLSPAGGPITALERWVFKTGTIVGGAFPSSHVAVAFVVTACSVRFRVAPYVVLPLFIGLALSTIFAGYHYGVDVLYGAVVGALIATGVAVAMAPKPSPARGGSETPIPLGHLGAFRKRRPNE
jgi:membrane-associated phospholipid phosphatase